jgi:hypothetical protein
MTGTGSFFAQFSMGYVSFYAYGKNLRPPFAPGLCTMKQSAIDPGLGHQARVFACVSVDSIRFLRH